VYGLIAACCTSLKDCSPGTGKSTGRIDTNSRAAGGSLYPHGFSAERFVEVIVTEAAWDVRGSASGAPTRGSATGAVPR
jgi:hypothetical protein